MVDVFISYRHLDNVADDGDGWVTRFGRLLQARVNQVSPETFALWRDMIDQDRSKETDSLLSDAAGARALICVVSPPYRVSQWGERERSAFMKASLGAERPIFKVVKLPHDPNHPKIPILDNRPGYDFYLVTADGTAVELDPKDDALAYRRVLTRLARDIARKLSRNRREPTVLLGTATKDLVDARASLQTELERERGVATIDIEATSAGEAEAEVRQLLEKVSLSVHFLGNIRPQSPEGSSKSLLEIECAIASQLATSARRSIVWVPPQTLPTDDGHRNFLESLRKNAGPLELLEGDFEQLRKHVADQADREKPLEVQPSTLVLLHDKEDQRSADTIHKTLLDLRRDLYVLRPGVDGDSDVIGKARDEALQTASAILVHWGRASQAWVTSVIGEVRKAGAGRSKFTAKAVHIADPIDTSKELFKWPEYVVVRDRWEEFLSRL